MKVSYPEKDGKANDLKFGNQYGKYLISHFNTWHGGVHIEGNKKQIQAIADGRIIAYRFSEKYEELKRTNFFTDAETEEEQKSSKKNNDTEIEQDTNKKDIDAKVEQEDNETKPSLSLKQNIDSTMTSEKYVPKGEYTKIPTHKQFDKFNQFFKSFKILRQMIQSQTEFVFDDEESVEYIANTNIWNIILKPKKELKYNLFILVEQSESMDIYNELIIDFVKAVDRFSIFKNIKVYYIKQYKDSFNLYKDKKNKTKLSLKALNSDNQRNFTMILSDCISSGWGDKRGYTLFEKLTKITPLSIINMLPQRLWRRTPLKSSRRVKFTHKKSFLNDTLVSDIDEVDIKDNIKVPMTTLESIPLKQWSNLVAGKKNNWLYGSIFEANVFNKMTDIEIKDNTINTADDIVKNFDKYTSPIAKKLAIYFSTVPLSMDIMKIVQKENLQEANYTHLAEVFLSGLLKKSDKKTNTDDVIYEFIEGVQEILFARLSLHKKIDILSHNSSFISNNIGSVIDFQALLENPSLESGIALSDNDKVFAHIVADVFKEMGGKYTDVAQELESGIEQVKNEEFLQKYQEQIIKKLQETEICEHIHEEVYIGGTPKDGDYLKGIVSQCGDMPENIELSNIQKINDSVYKVEAKFDLNSFVEIYDFPHPPLTKEKEFVLEIEATLDVEFKEDAIVDLKIYDIIQDTIEDNQFDDF